MPSLTRFFRETLALPDDLLVYEAGLRLADLFPGFHLLETEDADFDLFAFAERGGCLLHPSDDAHAQTEAEWRPPRGAVLRLRNAVLDVQWRGHAFRAVVLWYGGDLGTRRTYLVGPDHDVLRRFFVAVCRHEGRGEGRVLEYADGYFSSSEELRDALADADLDRLTLPAPVREALDRDVLAFFDAESAYRSMGVPWRRGVLLTGPPGNGKTRVIRGLVRRLDRPTILVRSLETYRLTAAQGVRAVFARAREIAPCVLVLEDLDSLLPAEALSSLLNELDGFAANHGLLTLATTNHPDRLDPALAKRPSRFDRKIAFDLPDEATRLAYLEKSDMENRASPEARAKAARKTEGFSFAFLQETWVSTTMLWAAAPDEGFDRALKRAVRELRGQLR